MNQMSQTNNAGDITHGILVASTVLSTIWTFIKCIEWRLPSKSIEHKEKKTEDFVLSSAFTTVLWAVTSEYRG